VIRQGELERDAPGVGTDDLERGGPGGAGVGEKQKRRKPERGGGESGSSAVE